VGRGGLRQPALGKPEPLDARDPESGGGDGGQGVARGVTAAQQGGPDDVGDLLDPGQLGGIGSDVLEEAQFPTGPQHPVELGQTTGPHSGHTVTLYGLVRMGARPGFAARVVEAGFHQRAIGLVHTGAADTAAIDSQVLAIERRDHPRHADRWVVGSFGPSTIQPLVAASRLPRRLKDQIRAMLATI
jgi:hypothetical protein